MRFPIRRTIASYAIGWNTEFSPMDVEFMKRQYPKAAPAMTELTMGKRISADLATAGEVDEFHFGVASAATHIMSSTEGLTDTVLTLHGPGDRGAVLTWDDDRGQGTNARIVRKLQPGDYWLTVRHKKAAATGSYSVGVKKGLIQLRRRAATRARPCSTGTVCAKEMGIGDRHAVLLERQRLAPDPAGFLEMARSSRR